MLIGRDGALARVATLLESARGGEGSCLILTGDPGIGKTAVLDASIGLADGFAVLRAQGVESEADLPFAALSDLLRPSKTIEFHLGNVYRKLGVRSRTQLARALAEGEH